MTGGRLSGAQLTDALVALEQDLKREFSTQLGQLLDDVELVLLDTWPSIQDRNRREGARGASHWLKAHRQEFIREVSRQVIDGLFQRQDAASQVAMEYRDLSYLTLMDDSGLDLASENINATNAMLNRCRASFGELEARIEVLRERADLLDPRALSPGRFVETANQVMSACGASSATQAAFVAVISKPSAEFLLRIYTRLNALLSQHQVVPKLKITNVHSARPVVPKTAGQLARMLEARLKGIESELSELPGQPWNPGELRQEIERHFDPESYASLSGAQLRAIDQLESTLLTMLATREISPRFRAELKRLLVPLVTARVVRPEAFENPHSPMRALIQQLGVLGTLDALSPIGDFHRVNLVIDRVVAENGLELEGFRAGSQTLYTLIHRAATAAPDQQDLATQQAQAMVRRDLEKVIRARQLSPRIQVIVDSLLKPWMTKCYECFGEDSKAGIGALVSAHVFFAAVAPAKRPAARERMAQDHADALEEFNTWLYQSDMPPVEQRRLRKVLEDHLARLRQNW